MATKIIGGPHMPAFIAGIAVGVILTIAVQHFTAKPAETTEQKVLNAIPATGGLRESGTAN